MLRIILGSILLANVVRAAASFTAIPLPECAARFRNTNGWTGADGIASVALEDGRTLWLFGDTWIGAIRDGRHQHATMVNNTVALEYGRDLARDRLDFFWGRATNHQPAAIFVPVDGRGFFWPASGVAVNGRLFVFAQQIERTGGTGTFAFRGVATWLLEVTNPAAPPPEWKTVQRKLPYGQFGNARHLAFGGAALRQAGWVYIFGCDEERGQGLPQKHAVVARAPETALADFTRWQFWGRGAWQADADQITRLFNHAADEYSVSWQPTIRKFVAICTPNGMNAAIHLRLASALNGPWSEATTIYCCPKVGQHEGVFYYAAKGHPELSATNELLITYATNTGDFWYGAAHADLYWPNCIRLRINVE